MNLDSLGIRLVDLLVQISLWTGFGLLLHASIARRRPRTGAVLTTSIFVGIVILTGIALLPGVSSRLGTWLPSPIGVDVPESGQVSRTITSVEDLSQQRADSGNSLFIGWLGQILGAAADAQSRTVVPNPCSGYSWQSLLVGGVLFSAIVFVVRLILGLWAVRRLRLQSKPINDEILLRLVRELGTALGIQRAVELREVDELGSPATVGWRRPLLLLPSEWTTWTLDECRAVLAHELAHIHHADYLAWLFAQVVAALHGYHPLVRWCLSRLQGDQELGADAVAARHAGGRETYLQVLCSMTLRYGSRGVARPARAFLPVRLSLIWRVKMLRNQCWEEKRSLSWKQRLALAALMLGVGGLIAGLRSPVTADEAAKTPPPVPVAREPFELRYVEPGQGIGMIAVRPAVVLAQPGMAGLANRFEHETLDQFINQLFGPRNVRIKLSQIDQFVGNLRLYPQPVESGHTGSMTIDLNLIRLSEGLTWKALLANPMPGVERVSHNSGTYYRLPPKAAAHLVSVTGIRDLCCFFPDARTLVFGSEDHMKAKLDQRPSAVEWPWSADDWKSMEQGWFVAGIDARRFQEVIEKQFKGRIAAEKLEPFAALWRNGRGVLVTCPGMEEVTLRCLALGQRDVDSPVLQEAGQKALQWLISQNGRFTTSESKVPASTTTGSSVRFDFPLGKRLADLIGDSQTKVEESLPQVELEMCIYVVERGVLERMGQKPDRLEGGNAVIADLAMPGVLQAIQKERSDGKARNLASPRLVTFSGKCAKFEALGAAGNVEITLAPKVSADKLYIRTQLRLEVQDEAALGSSHRRVGAATLLAPVGKTVLMALPSTGENGKGDYLLLVTPHLVRP